mmetsp:Transcript_31661/g.53197  ORF Transcript_31661/g.53197 Transcript_31661/m.53197 type:complete len:423 (-) Transcript_31661:401-1669(-)|eukprot:CAMPEP_0198209482 /NCGR_PEP_ID=MMETSP1445-20131203/16291_1 /TAXON_ID=36898 /ORGANISM="Pyramimonas sp., Strain CCMP2087" /LENGTH=422 /DNA_ID=CAMNT_0043883271 /DNA_START=131 /DNA_END=1399 /DNA_ORIENTATION=+
MAASMVLQQLTSLKVVPSMHNLSARRSSLNSAAGLRIPKASAAQSLKMAVVAEKKKDKTDKKKKKKGDTVRTNATSAQADSAAKPVVDFDKLGFGLTPTAKMFVATKPRGSDEWKGGLVPYGKLEVSPAAGILNYGQGVFEGMKAYRTAKGRVVVFRPDENAKRMAAGAERMCLEEVPKDFFIKAVMDTVAANVDYIPPLDKGALYVRPLLIGTGPILGLAPAPECSFLIYVSPVASYFKGGITPIDLLVSTKFHRAAPGGAGGTKCVGNYAQVLTTQLSAKAEGYADVLYLDSVEDKYVEEVSSCNVFVVNGNVIRTPPAGETILPGITRKSVIEMARSEGYEVREEKVEVSELMTADEVFCTGTAVVVVPVGSITYKGEKKLYKEGAVGPVALQMYTRLTDLQYEKADDPFGWVQEVPLP